MSAIADRKVLFVNSVHGDPPAWLSRPEFVERVEAVEQPGLDERNWTRYAGLIFSMHADHIHLARHGAALEAFLAARGTLVLNGPARPSLLPELRPFIPLERPGRAGYRVARLADHPVFDGIDAAELSTRKGVAGFYGRGHHPPPPGALPLNGLGPTRVPVDWAYDRPGGGRLLIHAGNDLWTVMENEESNIRLMRQLIGWIEGGR